MNVILVTGSTGNVGMHVVRELAKRAVAVRAFTRDPARATAVLGAVDIARGDFSDPDSIRAAIDGVDAVFLACPNDPRQVEYETAVIDAVRAAEGPRVVKLSAIGADIGSPLGFWDWQGRIERHLRSSGLPATILQPSFYMTNVLASADAIAHTGKLFAPAAGAKIAMVDPRDVATAAAAVLTEDGHEGRTYTLTGPELLSFHDVAEQLSVATGCAVEFVHIPDDAARSAMLEAGMPQWMADNLVTLLGILRARADEVAPGVHVLTGREPRTFAEFAREYAGAFMR